MAGYLDAYGVIEARRERIIKRVLIWGVSTAVIALVVYFSFRNWREEHQMSQFLSLLEQKNYQAAYEMWGCTPQTPCKYYPIEKFNEDWGPQSAYADPSVIKIAHVDSCQSGVVFDIEAPKTQPVGLIVDRSTNAISFAPWPRCPGRHLQIMQFIKAHFG